MGKAASLAKYRDDLDTKSVKMRTMSFAILAKRWLCARL